MQPNLGGRPSVPIGTERVQPNGAIAVKVSPTSWRQKHHIVWEKHTGKKLQKGEVIYHKDGDRRNNAIENLCHSNRALPAISNVEKLITAYENLLPNERKEFRERIK